MLPGLEQRNAARIFLAFARFCLRSNTFTICLFLCGLWPPDRGTTYDYLVDSSDGQSGPRQASG